MGSIFKKVVQIAAPIIGSAIPGVGTALGAALGGAVGGAVGGGGIKGALLGAATGFAGNAIGSSITSSLGNSLGKVGTTSIGSLTAKNAMGPYTLGSALSGTSGNAIGNALANTTINQAVGGYAGNTLANSLASGFMPESGSSIKTTTPAPFNPTRSNQIDLPGSLSDLKNLDEQQQSSNLATQGVYGSGLGKEENTYFNDLINRKLIDTSGNVDQDLSDLSPIEQSYLSQMGIDGSKTPRGLLEALSKWRQA